ncbi:protein-L-isoaspartate(D-aspartate) O-methyltransferase [Actinocorallia sp. A-T 12471]|uniref:protein-L-isoaspartate(D-aspartate) O-methyltransferase n=1 Tax=Actinocorallia sp. A-T 12471 TaxID=3089813 RepID=UPI0029D2BA23|nr:protein-L-isoaspartate(D-aspartate) O-methyltransferase [Actinocorallia sp. A-T 12471]MDX6745092.1 protein-L-isoaspartate(D-aspartate) O-methyltransferase [Actinocorallia sp. A-T 12471]
MSGPDALVGDLAARGVLTDGRVRAALLAVPRHLFVPRRGWVSPDRADAEGFLADSVADPEGWWTAAYSDASIWLQADDGAEDPTTGRGFATSSLSAPGVVVEFLQLLGVRPGHRVLEVGTASGWTAALLEHLSGGAGSVYSVEVDENVAASAAVALDARGSRVIRVLGDGALGVPEAAPFDRVHITCAVTAIPSALVRQTRPGGIIVAPWSPGGPDGHRLRLTVTGEETATGTLHGRANYMLMRSQRYGRWRAHHVERAETSTTALDPREIAGAGPGAALAIAACAPGVSWHTVSDEAGAVSLLLCERNRAEGSWAACDHEPGAARFGVTQYGERRLWDEVENAFLRWCSWGRPGLERFGVALAGAELTVWLDAPGRIVR